MAWLIDSYGIEFLRSGSGILDVAGGAGGLAFELAFRRSIPCVVVDPRPMRLNPKQSRALKYKHAPVTTISRETTVAKNDEAAEVVAVLETACTPCASDADDGDQSIASGALHVPAEYAAAWAELGLPAQTVPRQVCAEFDESFATGPHAALWRSCSMVVGMHPSRDATDISKPS